MHATQLRHQSYGIFLVDKHMKIRLSHIYTFISILVLLSAFHYHLWTYNDESVNFTSRIPYLTFLSIVLTIIYSVYKGRNGKTDDNK